MKRLVALLALSAMAACVQEPSTPYARVTLDTLTADVVGQKLFYKGGFMTINADGTVDGTFRGGFNGTWEWTDGYWCRETPGIDPVNDCQLLEMSGNRVRATRNKGSGRSFIYTIGG